jgi:histidinol phosphatase-like enzyme
MAASRALLKGPYVCPHRFRTPCPCAKPRALLYERAAADHGLRLACAFVVGDSTEDMEAARGFGGTGCLVRPGDPARDGEADRARLLARYTGRSLT